MPLEHILVIFTNMYYLQKIIILGIFSGSPLLDYSQLLDFS